MYPKKDFLRPLEALVQGGPSSLQLNSILEISKLENWGILTLQKNHPLFVSLNLQQTVSRMVVGYPQ